MAIGISQWIGALVRHNVYANTILFQVAARLSIEELEAATSPSRESAFRLLVHLATVEDNYLSQVTGASRLFGQGTVSSLEGLLALVPEHNRRLVEFGSSSSDGDFERVVEFGFSNGAHLRYPAWQLITQALMHSTQHRGELSILLSELGHPLPIDDLIVSFTEESGQPWPFKTK